MTPLWDKLNLKDQKSMVVINPPDSFEEQIDSLEGITVNRNLSRSVSTSFFIVFATKLAQIEKAAKSIAKAKGDPIVWIAYPKGSSKRYTCEFNRDTGWAALGEAGFEGVRQVAIDEDWSALRFRRVEQIKTMKRDPRGAISKEGKARTRRKT